MKIPRKRTVVGLILLWPVWFVLVFLVGMGGYQIYQNPLPSLVVLGSVLAIISAIAGAEILTRDD